VSFGAPPAELVWFVGPASQAYDCLLYRAMTTELWIAAAFGGVHRADLWHSAYVEGRREVWERACNGLGIGTD
jgi:hypothetical protein